MALATVSEHRTGDALKPRRERGQINIAEMVKDVPPDAGLVNRANPFKLGPARRGQHRKRPARIPAAAHPRRQARVI
ncbi:MAG TPA: hypothetical protein VGG83_12495 [Trebonia sp.]